jgi:2-methylcitrate dehydratase PrpD
VIIPQKSHSWWYSFRGEGHRIKQASGGNTDKTIVSTCNFLGTAATSARMLGLDHKKFQDALYLAFHQMCGAASSGVHAFGELKGVSNGFAVKAGIISALMAEKGFTASHDFLEAGNKANFYEIFCGGSYMPWLLTADLGKTYTGSITAQKEFPCCHGQHAAIEAVLSLVKENHLKPVDIEEVNLRLSPFDYFGLAEPLDSKQNPQNIIDSQFSVCWGVASAIVYGEVGIKNFSDEALLNGKVREMARKVKARNDQSMTREYGFMPAAAEIKTHNGKAYSGKVQSVLCRDYFAIDSSG